MFTRTCYGSQDRAVRLNAEAFSVRNQVKQLYLGKDTTSKHQTCTVVLLSVYIPNDIPILALESVLGSLHRKKIIHCPIMERVTRLYIQQHSSVLKAATMAKGWCVAAW